MLFILVALHAGSLTAQQQKESYNGKLEWQLGVSAGTSLPVSKLLSGRPTDQLVNYSNTSSNLSYSLGVFFHPRWGLEFSIGNVHSPKDGRKEKFYAALQSQYADRYLIDPYPGLERNNFSSIAGMRAMLGVTYRWEKKNWLFFPKLSAGITDFSTTDYIIYLKEKGGNHYQQLAFIYPPVNGPTAFTIGLAGVAKYRINRWLAVSGELNSTYFKANFTFNKTIQDLDTKTLLSEAIPYREHVFTFTPQVGLTICLKPHPNPRAKQLSPKNKKYKNPLYF